MMLLDVFKKKDVRCTVISTPVGYKVCKGKTGNDKSVVLRSFEIKTEHLPLREQASCRRILLQMAVDYARQEIDREGR